MTMENEFSTAVRYFIQYSKKGAVEDTTQTEREELSKQDDFWVEDIWTEDDEINAKRLLQLNEERCTISSIDLKTNVPFGKGSEDGIAWNKFYQDHGTRFFKDRHYFSKAFPEEFGPQESRVGLQKVDKVLVEIGCGVGNACLPLVEDDASPWKTIHALDISAEAIALLQQDPRYIQCNHTTGTTGRSFHGHVCDISQSFPIGCVGVSDVTTLLFCLSALDPDDMPRAAEHVASSLRPSGVLVFRDYGRYDEAQMKLGVSRNKRIKDNFYRKHDGTKCYYFSLDDVEKLFVEAGLKILELKYLRRTYGNRALGEVRRRVWVQARFVKPNDESKATKKQHN